MCAEANLSPLHKFWLLAKVSRDVCWNNALELRTMCSELSRKYALKMHVRCNGGRGFRHLSNNTQTSFLCKCGRDCVSSVWISCCTPPAFALFICRTSKIT